MKDSKVIGGIGVKKSNGGRQWYLQNRIYDGDIAVTVTPSSNPYYLVERSKMENNINNNCMPKEPFIVASRGRNPENPSDRKAGSHTVQRLEQNSRGISNTLTTVQKDNLVVEPTLAIRKLTPKECFRLMGFTDDEFDRAAKCNSNSQLYKQAGNSIVVNVLVEILRKLYKEVI